MSSFVQITNDLMAKELSNKWNALVPLPQQSENVPEINKASDLINRLTPENSKKEIHQLKRLIHKMQEQLNTIKVTNTGGSIRGLGIRAVNSAQTGGLANVLIFKIDDGGHNENFYG